MARLNSQGSLCSAATVHQEINFPNKKNKSPGGISLGDLLRMEIFNNSGNSEKLMSYVENEEITGNSSFLINVLVGK